MSNSTAVQTFTAPEPGLQELWGRALCSDHDRGAWLEHRRTGVTATDAKVAGRSRETTIRTHLRKKASGTDAEFRGNKATEWGNYREAQIINDLDGTEFVRCGLLIHAVGNKRKLATPDLAGVNFLGEVELGEVKTSEKDLNPAGPDFAETRYLEQILWQLIVTGAERVRLIVDQHDGDWSRWASKPSREWSYPDGTTLADYGPKVIAQHWYVFDRVDYAAEIVALEAKVDRALVILEEELAGFVEEGPETFTVIERLEIGAEARRYVLAGQRAKAQAEVGKEAKAALFELVKTRKAFSDRFDNVKVTYSPAATSPGPQVADVDAAKLAQPEAWERLQSAIATATAAQDQWDAVLAEHMVGGPAVSSDTKITFTAPRGGIVDNDSEGK